MAWTLNQILHLLHPVMPFITEELWKSQYDVNKSMILEPWPELPESLIDKKIIKNLSKTMDISADALQGLFADSGKYAQDFVTEKDFARIMGQFEFHGSVFAKEIVARLKAQLAEAQKQAVNA